MLSHAKSPRSFWAETMRTAVDLINSYPSLSLNGDVPEKNWSSKDVTYDHLRVFSCWVFVHNSKDERSKLDSKRQNNAFFFAMGMRNLAIDCGIQLARKSF